MHSAAVYEHLIKLDQTWVIGFRYMLASIYIGPKDLRRLNTIIALTLLKPLPLKDG